MLIDWFTIIAQIINFVILVLLLRRFLYRPILRVMREREERIKTQLAEAEQKQREAEEQILLYQQKNQEWVLEREELLREARHEVESTRKDLMKKVRQEIEEHQTQWNQAIEREKKEFLDSLRKRISQQTFLTIRRVLNDLADVDLETHICKVFIERLRNLDSKQVEDYRLALEQSGLPVLVRSAFKLPQETRHQIEEIIHDIFLNRKIVNFTVDPNLMCGIELSAAGYKLVWSLSEYLERLDDLFEEGISLKVGE